MLYSEFMQSLHEYNSHSAAKTILVVTIQGSTGLSTLKGTLKGMRVVILQLMSKHIIILCIRNTKVQKVHCEIATVHCMSLTTIDQFIQ